mgnify:CR=1 FL=1
MFVISLWRSSILVHFRSQGKMEAMRLMTASLVTLVFLQHAAAQTRPQLLSTSSWAAYQDVAMSVPYEYVICHEATTFNRVLSKTETEVLVPSFQSY